MKHLIFSVIVLLAFSCAKPEGRGGNSSITGKVHLEMYNSTFTLIDYETPAQDYDVFIVYGDHVSYNDKTTTDFEGDFTFEYLYPGDYTIYVYSKIKSVEAANGDIHDEEALIQTITIAEGQEAVLDDFTVADN